MKKYQCNDCKALFHSADGDNARCPQCGSMAVSPVGMTRSKLIGLVAAGLCSAALGFFVTDALMPKSQKVSMTDVTAQSSTNEPSATTKSPEITEKNPSQTDTTQSASELDKEVAQNGKKMALRATTPKASAAGTYSVTVIADNVPEGCKVQYQLLNIKGNRLLGTSSSGSFSGIRPDGPKFVAVAQATRGGQTVAKATKVISGFSSATDTAKPEGKRLSAGELQALISARSAKLLGAGSHPLVANHVSLSFTNLRAGDPKPQVIQDIYTKIRMNQWLSVSVVGVGYDASNKVNSITFSINYPAED